MRINTLVLVLFLIAMTQTYAQEKNKFRLDVALGYASSVNSENGFLINLEPKWVLTQNSIIGLRLGAAVYGKSFKENEVTISTRAEERLGASASILATFDYHFHKNGSSFAPFIGLGFGYYQVANVEDDNSLSTNVEIDLDNKIGAMMRGGFDLGKLRFALEYNLIGNSDLRNQNNEVIGVSKNGYFGISIGSYFGGGKWNR